MDNIVEPLRGRHRRVAPDDASKAKEEEINLSEGSQNIESPSFLADVIEAPFGRVISKPHLQLSRPIKSFLKWYICGGVRSLWEFYGPLSG